MTQRREYIPRAYGPMVVEFLLRHQRCNLWAPPGFGKTSMTFTALDAMYLLGMESRPTLVIGPLRVARDVWSTEAAKWQHLRDIDVVTLCGAPKQREAALHQDAAVFTVNYDKLPWLVDHLGDRWPFGTVIADESTRIKSFRMTQGGKRAHALAKVAWTHVNRWVNLTGTPLPNGLQDLWGQMWFVDKGHRLGRTFTAFTQRWFRTGFDGFGLHPFPHSQKEIEDKIRDVTLALKVEDWFDVREPIVNEVRVRLPPAAMKVYKSFEKTMFAELSCGSELEVFNAAALTNKCLQIANGVVYHEDGEKPLHDAKLEALESLVEEINQPILVAYSFRSDIPRIRKLFGNRVALLGEESGMRAFRAGKADIGLTHDASLGHGVDGLQDVTNVLIRFGHTWNLENRLQLVERIGPVRQMQSGHDRPVLIYDIVAEDTLDEDVIVRHKTKAEVQDILLSAMRRKQ